METIMSRTVVVMSHPQGSQNISKATEQIIRPCRASPIKSSATDRSTDASVSSHAEAPTSGRGASLSPLPLHTSRSVFPAPLQFLWFNTENEGETRIGDDTLTTLCFPREDETISVSSGVDNMERQSDQEIEETPEALIVLQREECGSDINDSTSWLQNIMNLKSLWRTQNDDEADVSPLCDEKRQESCQTSVRLDEATVSTSNIADSSDTCGCSKCEVDSIQSNQDNNPRVSHNKDSFSKFLHQIPLSELRLVGQMSFLCNLAYIIPKIDQGELYKFHHLRYVTSSVDRKAAALPKDKGSVEKSENSASESVQAESVSSDVDFDIVDKQGACVNPGTAYALDTAASYLHSQAKTSEGDEAAAVEFLLKGAESEMSFAVASYIAATPVTTVVAAEENTKQEVVKDFQSVHSCPCEWFVCDHRGTHTRHFAIQGSESIASWKANLLFEPIHFEDPKLGVVVHRGIYEAAKGLYEQVIQLVHAHIREHGEKARLRFTGHSLGGSLAVLLSLMLRFRGAVPSSAILPVYAFGAPSIMCGGDHLLRQLGLLPCHIQSVVMHRDLVPRTFSCDYPDHIAEVLKRVNGTFRKHSCLLHQRLLYAPMGQMIILQPDDSQAPAHPLLPEGSGMYAVQLPELHVDNEILAPTLQVRSAERAFLNMPHPLEILSDPGAYGWGGAVSRDHDPRSYSKAVNHVIRKELKRWRRLHREQRKQVLWPLVSAKPFTVSQIQTDVGISIDTRAIGYKGPASSGVGVQFQDLRRRASFVTAGVANFSPRPNLLGSCGSQHTKLVAAKHVHFRWLVIFSAPVLLLKLLPTLFF